MQLQDGLCLLLDDLSQPCQAALRTCTQLTALTTEQEGSAADMEQGHRCAGAAQQPSDSAVHERAHTCPKALTRGRRLGSRLLMVRLGVLELLPDFRRAMYV